MDSYIPQATRKNEAIRNMAVDVPEDKLYLHTDALVPWQDNTTYTVGASVEYKGLYYRCLTPHTSNAAAGWVPDVPGALWAEISNPADEWPEWKQPTSAETAYSIGAKVTHKEKRYISKINANTTEPGTDARWWEEQT
ncbi:hypothetical protein LJC07_04020 [Christensenellaceae bacterium OttesenSCG-928-L17]|nr:hypothetical protein [Christensenellaceae bacterium OttesenSCG-928-L17]